jgi:hypothetical protein
LSLLDLRFEVAARHRPVDLVRPGPLPPAPYAAVTGSGTLSLASAGVEVRGGYDGSRGHAWLSVDTGGRRPTRHRSRRHGRASAPVDAVGLTLTGTQVTVLTREAGRWVARGRVDLEGRVDTRDEAWLAGLGAEGGTAGRFGQLGLRDLRLVTRADGSPYRVGRLLLLTATSAGPGFFATAHTSVWSLDPDTLELAHRSDLFFRRPDAPGVYGDHATHLVRDDGPGRPGRWLVATSSWGDFDKRRPVRVLLAATSADLLSGTHVLDTEVLALPTDGLTSVAVWDPHLVRTDDGWLVGYVSASRYFRFHPVVAGGPTLDHLRVLGADPGRRACEGTTLHRDPRAGAWRVLASDRRGEYPVYDLALDQVGRLDAPYPSNLPWPTVVEVDGGWLLVAFNGRGYGGRLTGYGTHGEVVIMRSTPPASGG